MPEDPARLDEADDVTRYAVVVNLEEQYSIWPEDRPLPLGWTAVGKTGTRTECLTYVEQVWTDMRPRSVRQRHANSEPTP